MMHVNYSIIAPDGTVYETGAAREDHIPARCPDGYGWLRHDGSVTEGALPLRPDQIDPDCIYALRDGALIAVSAAPECRVQDDHAQIAREYLAETDWMVVRSVETGKPVPEDVLAKRAAAREQVSQGD